MKILVTPTFKRSAKRLRKKEKAELDEAVRAIAADPEQGEGKSGDLAHIRVYKYKVGRQLFLLVYEVVGKATIKLLALGTHENFYRDLKR